MPKLNVSQRVRCYSFALEVQLINSTNNYWVLPVCWILCWCSESVTIDTVPVPQTLREHRPMNAGRLASFSVGEHQRDTILVLVRSWKDFWREQGLSRGLNRISDFVRWLNICPFVNPEKCNMLVIPWYPWRQLWVCIYMND